ncbi:MAG: hypothetical protein WC862_02615 [Patescibacteria group bacterium]
MTNHEQHHGHEEQPSCCAQPRDGQKTAPLDALDALDTPATPAEQVGNSAVLKHLEEEILQTISGRRRAPLSFGSVTISVALGLLVLVSLVQVAQSVSLYNKLKLGDLKPSATAAVPASGSASSLPNQVGGC